MRGIRCICTRLTPKVRSRTWECILAGTPGKNGSITLGGSQARARRVHGAYDALAAVTTLMPLIVHEETNETSKMQRTSVEHQGFCATLTECCMTGPMRMCGSNVRVKVSLGVRWGNILIAWHHAWRVLVIAVPYGQTPFSETCLIGGCGFLPQMISVDRT